MLANIKNFVKNYQADIVLIIGVILISLFSFAAGFITAKYQNKEPIQFEMSNSQLPISNKISNAKRPMLNYWKLKSKPSGSPFWIQGNWKLL